MDRKYNQELHAHINGSISRKTMDKLVEKRPADVKDWRLDFDKGHTGTLNDAMQMFSFIHKITCSTEATYMITRDVIHDFASENVKYLELRTTPREETTTGMTKRSYVETVLKAIEDTPKENLDIIVRLILSINRRYSVADAMETVALAEEYARKSNNVIVGVDLSGDPYAGSASDFIPALQRAKDKGLKLALHLAEVPALEETLDVLRSVPPDRIGHGTCLQADAGGSHDLVELVGRLNIPLELCLSSNVTTETVSGYDNHHFQFWFDRKHPCVICTDDKGVFSTSLTEEYSIAADTFDLSREDVWCLSYNSIDHIFADETVKQQLRQKWNKLQPTLL